jgi:hypothetical protein
MVNYERCKRLVKAVESLSKTEIEELFKMIHKKTTNYTRNNNGVFLNLAWVSDDIIEEMENYVQFCTSSHIELKKYESICDVLNNSIKNTKTETQKIYKTKNIKTTTKANASTSANQPSTTEVLNNIQIKSELDMNANDDVQEDDAGVYSMLSSSVRYTMFKKKFAKQCYQTRLQDYTNDLVKDDYICV